MSEVEKLENEISNLSLLVSDVFDVIAEMSTLHQFVILNKAAKVYIKRLENKS